MTIRRWTAVCVLWLCVVGAPSRPAAAQPPASSTQSATPSAPTRRPLWTIEIHAGGSFDRAQPNGSATLPVTGALVQERVSASTLLFGSAAALFNQNRQATPIVPLDTVLSSMGALRSRGVALGGRVERAITERLGIEVAGDYLRGHVAFTPALSSGVSATRASYESALGQTLALSSESSSATAVATITDRQLATRLTATASLVAHLRRSGAARPYVLAGGGVMVTHPNALVATLQGTYRLGTTSYVQATDLVSIRYAEASRSYVALGGAGAIYALSSRTGIRVDARAHVYKNSSVSLVDATATPSVQSLGPTLPIANFNALQFSAIGPMNGPPISGTPTFTGSGLRVHAVVSAGLFLRF